MSRFSIKWAPLALALVFSWLLCNLSLVLWNDEVRFGFSIAQAGQPSSPDLTVSSLNNPPSSAVVGGSFSVTDTTGNSGSAVDKDAYLAQVVRYIH